jgi:hypothetical protein
MVDRDFEQPLGVSRWRLRNRILLEGRRLMKSRKGTRSPRAVDFMAGALIGLSIVVAVFVLMA